jgi:hypothetical protein
LGGQTATVSRPSSNEAKEETEPPVSIVDAVRAYLSDAKARNLSDATVYKLKIIFEKQFLSWCAHKGYRFLTQFDVDALREFRQTWKDAPLARGKKQARDRLLLLLRPIRMVDSESRGSIGTNQSCSKANRLFRTPAILGSNRRHASLPRHALAAR